MKIRHKTNDQLMLNLGPRLDAQLSDFAGPGWSAIISAIYDLLTGNHDRCFVYGEPDTGKTHLLAAACESYNEQGFKAILLSLRELIRTNKPDCLESLEHYDLIALDDIEVIQGFIEWQEALFHLLNRATTSETKILLAARLRPSALGLHLADLVSRLNQAACFCIPNGEDSHDREALLLAALGRRNLNLEPEITRYLLQKGPHRTGLLLKHLSFLENSALQQQKRLTLQFVKQLTERS